MSRRWVTREEFTAATAATDPNRLIRKYLPYLSAEVATKYRWVEERDCVFSVDDLIQISSIALMKRAERWERDVLANDFTPAADGTYDAAFYMFVKRDIHDVIINHVKARATRGISIGLTVDYEGEEVDRGDLYEVTDGEIHDRTGVRRRPDGPWWGAVVDSIMTFWDTLPPKEKTAVALRYYDELPNARVTDLVGANKDLPRTVANRWRAHARNQMRLGGEQEEIAQARPLEWAPSELLTEYIRFRHRKDIHEYLGVVTISFKTDPDYLVNILGIGKNYAPGTKSKITPEQIAEIDRMAADGISSRQIALTLGMNAGTVNYRVNPRVADNVCRRSNLRHHNRSRAA